MTDDADIRGALDHAVPHYQPIVGLNTGEVAAEVPEQLVQAGSPSQGTGPAPASPGAQWT